MIFSLPEPSRHLRWLRVHAVLTVSSTSCSKPSQIFINLYKLLQEIECRLYEYYALKKNIQFFAKVLDTKCPKPRAPRERAATVGGVRVLNLT